MTSAWNLDEVRLTTGPEKPLLGSLKHDIDKANGWMSLWLSRYLVVWNCFTHV